LSPSIHLPRRLGAILALAAALTLTLLVSASPAPAAAPCWKQVVQDYYDNYRVDDTYPVSCYRKAIEELPTDVEQYSNAADEIRRALQESLSRPRGGGSGGATTPATTTGGGTKTTTVPTTPVETTTAPTTTSGVTPLPTDGTGGSGSGSGGNGGDGGSKQAAGSGGKPLDVLRPDKADSFPLPLIILAAIALLLLAAGAAGFVARRMQRDRLRALPQGEGAPSSATPALPPSDAPRD
jgi:hypothetical protein